MTKLMTVVESMLKETFKLSIEEANTILAEFCGLIRDDGQDFGGQTKEMWFHKGGSRRFDGAPDYHYNYHSLMLYVEFINRYRTEHYYSEDGLKTEFALSVEIHSRGTTVTANFKYMGDCRKPYEKVFKSNHEQKFVSIYEAILKCVLWVKSNQS